MPSRKSAKSASSLESIIEYNVSALKGEPEGSYEITKEIVCSFYKKGNCPACVGCRQPDEQLELCKTEYLKFIETRPRLVWDKEFSAFKKREKVKISSIEDMGLNCDNCYLSESCPLYEAGAMCAIDWEEEGEMTPKKVIAKLVDIQFKRVNRGSKIEEMDGGVPDQTLSTEIDRLTALTQTQNEFNLDKFELSIKAEAQNAGGGILASLLGRPVNNNQNNQNNKVEDIKHTELPYEPVMPIPVKTNLEKPEKVKK